MTSAPSYAATETAAQPEVDPRPVAPPSPHWVGPASWAMVAAGLVMQVYAYLGGRVLWLDEAMVALNIRFLSVQELTRRLDYDQVAPFGWLLLEKLCLAAPIPFEYALRLPALVAGVAGLLLFRQLAFCVLGGLGALTAVTLYAWSSPLIRYAQEVKPYGVDALFTVVLLWIGYDLLVRDRASPARLALLFLAGLIGVTLSLPVVYILATVGGVLILQRMTRRRWIEAAAVAAAGLCWLALFGALYLNVYHGQISGTSLEAGGNADFFKANAYAPLPNAPGAVGWYAGWLNDAVQFYFGSDSRFAILLTAGCGLAALIAGRRLWLGLLVGAPAVLAMVGSVLQVYPIFDRLLLFLAAPIMLLLGAGAAWLAGRTRAPVAVAGLLTLFCVAGGIPYLQGSLREQPPFSFNNMGSAFETLRRERRPGDLVYVSNQAIPAFLNYRERYGFSDVAWLPGKAAHPSWPCFIQDIVRERSQGRIWVLLLTVGSRTPPEPLPLDLALGARNLAGAPRLAASGWNVWLYELNLAPRDAAAPFPAPVPDLACDRFDTGQRFDASPRMLSRVP